MKTNTFKAIAIAVLLLSATIGNTKGQAEEVGVEINGVKWATCNVDAPGTFAAKPEDAGMFYQWNRNKGWAATGEVTDWDSSIPKGDIWEKEHDPCPPGWRVPTRAELQSLIVAGSEWTTLNGVKGRVFGADDNTVFFPAVGSRFFSDGTLNEAGSYGSYTSGMPSSNTSVYYLVFSDELETEGNDGRRFGRSVRCVSSL
jgi:uncharacterized protein (TIGR02145 family)